MIEIENLSKRYGDLVAVDNMSFRVEPGEVLGFLGPNGAGKSTTMKMIAGFLTPTAGQARVGGIDVAVDPIAAKRQIGYLPEGAPSYGEMTVGAFLRFVADVRELDDSVRERRTREMVERLHLGHVWQQSIGTLSKGYRRRVGLAQALIHDPQVLILDEPTDGLDPNQKHEVRALINDIAADKTVIISTHILEEVNAVCDRAMIIAHGRILADERPAALEARSRFHRAVVLVTPQWEEAIAPLSALDEVIKVEVDGDGERLLALTNGNPDAYDRINSMVREQNWSVRELSVERGRLDDVFRQITLGDDREVA